MEHTGFINTRTLREPSFRGIEIKGPGITRFYAHEYKENLISTFHEAILKVKQTGTEEMRQAIQQERMYQKQL